MSKRVAHSKSEYKRVKAQGGEIDPPTVSPLPAGPVTAERDAEESAFKNWFSKFTTARAAIVADTNGERMRQGQIECPLCQNTLRYSIASNGHIHAACNGPDCVRWME